MKKNGTEGVERIRDIVTRWTNIVFKLCVLFNNTISLWLRFVELDGRFLNTLEWYFYCCSVFKSSSNILPPYLEDSSTQ